MTLSQKCQYALRAIFELCLRFGQGPVSISETAEAQAIPARFLEQILAQARQAGYVESRRGIQGGYMLAAAPDKLTVGEVIRYFEGPLMPVKCVAGQGGGDCPLRGNCAFKVLWKRAEEAASAVYDSTTFQDLVDEYKSSAARYALNYCI